MVKDRADVVLAAFSGVFIAFVSDMAFASAFETEEVAIVESIHIDGASQVTVLSC